MVNNDIFVSFQDCKRKAFLRAAGAPGHPADIETVLLDLGLAYRHQALKAFLAPFREEDVLQDPPDMNTALKSKRPVIVNATASVDGLSSLIHAAERVKGVDQGGAFTYSPVLFIPNETVSRADKLLLAFNGLALFSLQGLLPNTGKIIHGSSFKVLRCKIEPLAAEVRKLVAQIQAAQADSAVAPRVVLNRHCNRCEFRPDCQLLAEKSDDLSLLRGMSEQEIEKQRKRGVTTVTQFAFTYRPGQRGKQKTGKARKHDHALQAVAIRDKKVYVLDSPTVPRSHAALYLDIEGVPDRGFDYLIGLVAVVDGRETTYSFWADDPVQETMIWDACRRVIDSFEDYTLYHYGQYELRFLDRMRRLADQDGVAAIDRIRARSCNVLASLYSHIYFPTRSNGLKDIATFLGATWTAANASGIQSLAWRLAWETHPDEALKQNLLLYNLEDSVALRRVTEFVLSVCEGAAVQLEGTGPTVASAQDIPCTRQSHFGNVEFFCPELTYINKCAYSDYQREKVYVRTSPALRKSLRRKKDACRRRLKINEKVECERPQVCSRCGSRQVWIWGRQTYSKTVSDLRFTASGVKRWVTRYSSLRYCCSTCGKSLLSDAYRAAGSRLGNNLSSWVMYQNIALRQGYDDIDDGLKDMFGFTFTFSVLGRIKPTMAAKYQITCDRLKEKLRHGTLIHADETKVKVKTHVGYVWAFTNLEEVVYIYTPTREGIILDEVLDGFHGVLVSDYYAAYDSAKCSQQKCLIHLIRDINDDLFHSPFDTELKQLAQRLVTVLKPIIDTIDKHGLKQYYLHKHKDDVTRYFGYLFAQAFESEMARKYQKRMQKFRDKLFVFLDHDGIPWNNNNAENAIKGFASRRRNLGASSSEKGLREYLVFLSIYQTCRRKNVSFLRFLLSGKQDIDAFADDPSH